MRSEDERKLAHRLKEEGMSLKAIGEMLEISKSSVQNLLNYKPKIKCLQRGPNFRINKYDKMKMKREISRLNDLSERTTSSKLKKSCELDVSVRTVRRYLRNMNMKYTKIKKVIFLKKIHRQSRIRVIRSWMCKNHQWEKTVFIDEKRFNLDGPDDWRTWSRNPIEKFREMRQCKCGGVMIWMMMLPIGLLTYRVIEGNFKSVDYIKVLQNTAVPICKLNLCSDFYYQEDNCTVHKSKAVKTFIDMSNIKVLEWPSKSPDINIIEDVWKLISDEVYDGPQFSKKTDLVSKIKNVIDDINANQRLVLKNLYTTIRSRLCTVLENKGGLFNK